MMRCILFILATPWIVFSQAIDDSLIARAWQAANIKLGNTLDQLNNNSTKHPKITNSLEQDGNGRWQMSGRGGWTSGFFSGCLWHMAAKTNEDFWREKAAKWTADLESQKYNSGDHDIGFRMFCSYGQGYSQNQSEAYRQILLTAANTLASRFDESIGCIKSWDWTGNYAVIIDNMMNLELLFWAARNGGDSRLYDIAVSHADKTLVNHIRGDGSTWHVVDYNDDGTVRRKFTAQGYSDDSCWSRGQAWGLYGFTVAYRETGEIRFLRTAEKLADYFLANLPGDGVPYSDFNAPNIPDCEKDASAAAIACSALFELAGFSEKPYRSSARFILQHLIEDYLAPEESYQSILFRASQKWGDAERGTIYADYYFLEALRRFEATTSNVVRKEAQPATFKLSQNYPNPFNSSTTIEFSLSHAGRLRADIYDVAGRHVAQLADAAFSKGAHRLKWQADNAAGGVYFVKVQDYHEKHIMKIVLQR